MQRVLALFLIAVLYTSIITPPAFAISESITTAQSPTHRTATTPSETKMPSSSAYPAGEQPTESSNKAAPDARPSSNGLPAGLGTKTSGVALPGAPEQPVIKPGKITPHELTNKRTADTTETVNADGSITKKQFYSPQFYKKDNQWTKIDTKLSEDKNAGDAGTVFGQALGKAESWVSSTTNFIAKGNDWNARFSPSNSTRGMLRVKQGDSQIGFVPVDAKSIAPVITESNNIQTVHYYDLWPGVNVEYVVENGSVKENIVIKDREATNKVAFKVVGADLEQLADNDPSGGAYKIKGALGDGFTIARVNLILNHFGFVSKKDVYKQTYQNGEISVSVDKAYLQSLPDTAFPAVVDPGVFNSSFGTRNGGNYKSFKSDGYVCPASQCNLYAGTVVDTNYTVQEWRGMFYAPYDQFRNPNTVLTHATLHLTQRSNESFWTGDTGTHIYQAGHADCTWSYDCVDGLWNGATFSTAGDIDLTTMYQYYISHGDFGVWTMVLGEDNTINSYKNFDPNNTYMVFTYGGAPTAPTFATPSANQTFVDPQASFKVNGMTNPNGSQPLQYEMLVSTSPGAAGTASGSGLLPAGTQQWTVPDGVLQDGSTYYVQARTYEPISNVTSNWGASIPFKIDMRTGKDKTQTYDSLGPVDTDLATGNVMTSNSSHTSTALGGSLGVSLDYNSPLRSRTGLVGRYWNLSQGYTGGAPTTSPQLTRVDQNIDFDWGTGSPLTNTIANDNYYAQWNGYFIAPTTGTYYFGGSDDDGMEVRVNNQLQYSATCMSGICYDGHSISLTAGQVAPIQVDFREVSSSAYAHMYVKGAVDEKIVPSEWLRTDVRSVSNQGGLAGSYYGKFDGTNTFSSGNPLLLKRNDTTLNFGWGGTFMPNGPSGFLVRWSGYVTAPATGTYNFGAISSDGVRIKLGTSNTLVYDNWTPQWPNENFGSGYSMTAGVPIPITVEYISNGGNAYFALEVQGAVAKQVVPTAWLSPKAQALPAGWNLGLDPDGDLSYDHMQANQNSAVLSDSSGSTHEYSWTGSGYKPPVNEDGQLVHNTDGTYTLQDTDGKTYVFAADGTLSSVTTPTDDRKPAALRYSYGSTPGNGAAVLQQITDAVDSGRWAKMYYGSDGNCAAPPSGFDSTAPTGMLCAVKTNDGRSTYFYYTAGQLARIAKPGNENTDYFYSSVSNANGVVGYQLTGMRDNVAMDAIAAGVRTNDDTTKTQLTYDALGRVTSVVQPAATTGATRITNTIEYLPGALDKSYAGLTKQHVNGASEPNGFSRQVKYDALYRTIEDRDIANLATTTEWDPVKDMQYSSTDPTGLMKTTIYDDEDRPVSEYGPALAAWFGADHKPLTSYANQIPRDDTGYDEGVTGPSVAWSDYTKQAGNTSGVLSGAPKLHATGLYANQSPYMEYDFNTRPITPSPGAEGIGFSATGKLRLPNGTYQISANTADGVRVWVNDQMTVDSWIDGGSRWIDGTTFTVDNSQNNAPLRFRVDAYHKSVTYDYLTVWLRQINGFGYTTDWTNWIKPDYGLETSKKTYDATIGDAITKTSYGTSPELGLAQSKTLDPTGLNYSSTQGYETRGATGSFLRQTSTTLPAGNTTNYAYYAENETADNPCTTSTTEAYKQGGALKQKTEPDPDGGGPLAGRATQTIYDDAGKILATRYNSDPWTCTTYDARERVTQTNIPATGTGSARTVSNGYAVNGNPLIASTTDNKGTITTTIDLLGRTTSYQDVYGDTTTTTYDNLGKVSSESSPRGNVTYTYDSYNKLSGQSIDGVVYATPHYDAFNRLSSVDYPNANSLKLGTVSYDTLGRQSGLSYVMGDGTTTVSDSVTRSQSGQIVSGTENGLTKNYTYDLADRLTAATVGPYQFAYGYTTPTSLPTGASSTANKNSNVSTISNSFNSGTVTTQSYYYNTADQLINSTDKNIDVPTYDTHGNTLQLGTSGNGGTTTTTFSYDSSDRNISISQNSGAQKVDYDRDVSNRVIKRQLSQNGTASDTAYYGYTGTGDSPDYAKDSNGNITEKYYSLPGGALLTLRDNEGLATSKKTYSLMDIHGDTLRTADATGTKISDYLYSPFGQVLSTASNSLLTPNTPVQNQPSNAYSNASFSWAGKNQKFDESSFVLTPVQMGARVYIPGIGRFLQVDPQEGGTENSYVYPPDPVNDSDMDGMWSARSWLGAHSSGVAKTASVFATVTLIAGAAVCIAATAGACAAVGVGIAVAGGAMKTAQGVSKGSSWRSASISGARSAALDASLSFVGFAKPVRAAAKLRGSYPGMYGGAKKVSAKAVVTAFKASSPSYKNKAAVRSVVSVGTSWATNKFSNKVQKRFRW